MLSEISFCEHLWRLSSTEYQPAITLEEVAENENKRAEMDDQFRRSL